MEVEKTRQSLFRVCVIGNPYNKKATEEVGVLLDESTGPMTSRDLDVVDNPHLADLCIVMDAPPKEFANYAESGQVVLVTAQKRSKQSLNTYLKECEQHAQFSWGNVKVVSIDSESEDILVQKWWNLNLVVSSFAEDYPLHQ